MFPVFRQTKPKLLVVGKELNRYSAGGDSVSKTVNGQEAVIRKEANPQLLTLALTTFIEETAATIDPAPVPPRIYQIASLIHIPLINEG